MREGRGADNGFGAQIERIGANFKPSAASSAAHDIEHGDVLLDFQSSLQRLSQIGEWAEGDTCEEKSPSKLL